MVRNENMLDGLKALTEPMVMLYGDAIYLVYCTQNKENIKHINIWKNKLTIETV